MSRNFYEIVSSNTNDGYGECFNKVSKKYLWPLNEEDIKRLGRSDLFLFDVFNRHESYGNFDEYHSIIRSFNENMKIDFSTTLSREENRYDWFPKSNLNITYNNHFSCGRLCENINYVNKESDGKMYGYFYDIRRKELYLVKVDNKIGDMVVDFYSDFAQNPKDISVLTGFESELQILKDKIKSMGYEPDFTKTIRDNNILANTIIGVTNNGVDYIRHLVNPDQYLNTPFGFDNSSNSVCTDPVFKAKENTRLPFLKMVGNAIKSLKGDKR